MRQTSRNRSDHPADAPRGPVLSRLIPGALAAACALAAGALSAEEASAPSSAPAVVVAAVQSELVDHQGRFIGTIQAIQQVNVQARVEGFLSEVAFNEGSIVDTDQLLYQIEPSPFQAALAAANAQLASAVAATAKAQAELVDEQAQYERYLDLVKKGDVSQADFDRVKAQRDMAQAEVDNTKAMQMQAQANIQTAEINLGYTTIRSAIDGRIGQTNYTVGNLVGPASKILATVIQLDPIRAVFSISSADFVRVSERTPSDSNDYQAYVPELVLPTGETYAHKGKIAFIDNQINAATGSIAIYADFPNPNGILLPGQFITAVIHTAEQKREPMVPASAVIQTRDGQQVYVVGPDNRVALRTIKTSDQVGTKFAVSSGLQEGEIVVVSGIQKIKPGMIVAPSQADQTRPVPDAETPAGATSTPASTPAKGAATTEAAVETAKPPASDSTNETPAAAAPAPAAAPPPATAPAAPAGNGAAQTEDRG
jgi:membrane fusion protein (multidrug efflux system)